MAYPTPDANAGHVGNSAGAVMNNQANKCPADRGETALGAGDPYDPTDFTAQPGAAARRNGYPRLS